MGKLLLLSTLVLAVGVALYFTCFNCNKKTDLSVYRKDAWFGKKFVIKSVAGHQPVLKDNPEIRPFTINVTSEELTDLKNRLKNARFADHVENTQFQYGFNSLYLKEVAEYWRTKYDWRKEEARLNAQPQFKTQIEGLDIHFVHVKPKKTAKTVIPLLVAHGWPGSVVEYYKTFPLLTEPDANGLAFEVIAPSIPGFGYSEAPHSSGFDVAATARVYVKLMKRLGHEKFMVHGGDWGNAITRTISIVYRTNVIGAHILGNWDTFLIFESPSQFVRTIFASFFPSLYFGSENAAKEYAKVFPLKDTFGFLLAESGYFHIQATKPDTAGAALVDSPVGLAAWILEKFSTATNPNYRLREDGGLTEKFTLDEILTNVMVYWTSGNVAASLRYYKENVDNRNPILRNKILVPAGTVDVPYEIIRTPRALVEANYANLLQYSEFGRAGHFTAMEEPKLVADDIRSLTRKILQQQEEQKQQILAEEQKKKEEI